MYPVIDRRNLRSPRPGLAPSFELAELVSQFWSAASSAGLPPLDGPAGSAASAAICTIRAASARFCCSRAAMRAFASASSRSSWVCRRRSSPDRGPQRGLRFSGLILYGSGKRGEDRSEVDRGERARRREPFAPLRVRELSKVRIVGKAARSRMPRGPAPTNTLRPAAAAAGRRGCACLPGDRPGPRSSRRSRRGPGSPSASSRSGYRLGSARPCAPRPDAA